MQYMISESRECSTLGKWVDEKSSLNFFKKGVSGGYAPHCQQREVLTSHQLLSFQQILLRILCISLQVIQILLLKYFYSSKNAFLTHLNFSFFPVTRGFKLSVPSEFVKREPSKCSLLHLPLWRICILTVKTLVGSSCRRLLSCLL
jgi:hypothetical protein